MTKNPTPQLIDVDALQSSIYQYRRTFPPAEMAELAASIREHGVLQPILVRPIAGKKSLGLSHEIIAGERRWRAAREAGLRSIPAIIRPLSDIQAAQLALIENLQRENPDDWSTAQGIKNLMEVSARDGKPLSMREVAKMLDKSVGFVNNHLNLFKLRPALQSVAQRHNNVKSSLFEIQKVKDSEIEEELIEAIDNGAAYQEIKGRVERVLEDEQWRKDSQQAPDSQTAQRASLHNRTGGGNVSRGRVVTGQSTATARSEVERHLKGLQAWLPHLSRRDYERLVVPFARGIVEMKDA